MVYDGDMTPNLSGEFHPVPKPSKKEKKAPKSMTKVGKRTNAWLTGLPKLKEAFGAHGIVSCEIRLAGCKGAYLWGFAHVTRRGNYDSEHISDPHVVVFACQHCHTIIDDPSKTPKAKAEKVLQKIVDGRGW